MKQRLATAIAVTLALSVPAVAQDQSQDDGGGGLMGEGLNMLLEGLRKEVSPKLDALRSLVDDYGPAMESFLQEMGPAFASMLEEVKDWSRYHPPEILDNGDIIIRRKADAPPETDEKPGTLSETPPSGQQDI
ncbi:hypothetical protein [Pukyongiella litopenaei]|uniref:AAA+ family ATPase n=1 Tax=Pukyongiella litopenaei TaxID=2605946 RepID=A0A2S0MUL8_9RHOB|nr:hypothetical protein [Pukyongiella litopenaei]AVO39589.1 hypothetical protein C6Y53_01430 [Pukyongiella litopenaei]